MPRDTLAIPPVRRHFPGVVEVMAFRGDGFFARLRRWTANCHHAASRRATMRTLARRQHRIDRTVLAVFDGCRDGLDLEGLHARLPRGITFEEACESVKRLRGAARIRWVLAVSAQAPRGELLLYSVHHLK